MANTIQIKRGNSAPGNGVLLDGELGFDKANDQLYIGKVDGGSTVNIKVGLKNGVGYNEENQESAVVPLNADTLQGHPASDFRLSNWLPTAAQVGAAPAGYGLGEDSMYPPNNSVDEAVLNGWYYIAPSMTGAPSMPGLNSVGYGALLVINRTGLVTQEYYVEPHTGIGIYSIKLVRQKNNKGVWTDWEWVNPPMLAGVEYRTTERWNGKAVYTKLLNFGTATDYTTVSLGIAGTCSIIRQEGTLTDAGIVIPYNEFGGSNSFNILTAINAGEWRCTFRVGSNYSGRFTLALQAWYVKT